MTSHRLRGVGLGLVVGLVLVALLVYVPRARSGGGYYQSTDALIVMGVPLLVVGAVVGFVTGSPSRRGTMVVAVVACSVAIGFFLWGTGKLGALLP